MFHSFSLTITSGDEINKQSHLVCATPKFLRPSGTDERSPIFIQQALDIPITRTLIGTIVVFGEAFALIKTYDQTVPCAMFNNRPVRIPRLY
jgi:hypothetical protein